VLLKTDIIKICVTKMFLKLFISYIKSQVVEMMMKKTVMILKKIQALVILKKLY
jgi:hypothetical protein